MSTLTISNISSTRPLAGRMLCISATQSGGSNWVSNPLSVSGIPGALLNYQVVNSTTNATAIIYLGDAPGTLVVTDTVNGTTATIVVPASQPLRVVTGTQRYVKGGIRNPYGPTATVGGTSGSTQYIYQIIGINGAGKTLGASLVPATMQNIPISAGALTDFLAKYTTCVNNAPDVLTSTNKVTLTWPSVAGATGFDVIRFDTANGVWESVALNQAPAASNGLNTFVDNGGAAPDYTPPTNNTTALGSDSNNGLTPSTAFATCAKAASVSASGDGVAITGCGSDTLQVVWPAGVILSGAGMYNTVLATELNGGATHAGHVLPTGGQVSDLSFEVAASGSFAAGNLTSDQVTTDCELYRVAFVGFSNAFRISQTSGPCGYSFTDCESTSFHGTVGIFGANTTVVNATRCKFLVPSLDLSSGASASVAIQLSIGWMCVRDSVATASKDSQSGPFSQASVFFSSGALIRGAVFVNFTAEGATFEYNVSGTLANLFVTLKGACAYNADKNYMFTNYGPTVIGNGTYLADPVTAAMDVPLASNVKSGVPFGPDANGATTGTAPGTPPTLYDGTDKVRQAIADLHSGG